MLASRPIRRPRGEHQWRVRNGCFGLTGVRSGCRIGGGVERLEDDAPNRNSRRRYLMLALTEEGIHAEGTDHASRCELAPCAESSSSARERLDALDAEVLPFPVRWYVLVPGAHPARAGIWTPAVRFTIPSPARVASSATALTRAVG
jgi:hypothetical protein